MRLDRALGAVIAASVLASGCLLKEVSHTWYVAEDGVVTWVVIERDVRSDAQAPHDRRTEELEYYEAVKREDHAMARGFRALGAARLRTRVLRSELPYTVVTEARFTSLEVLGQRLIAASGLAGTAVLARDGASWEWTFSVRDPHVENPKSHEDVDALMSDMDKLQIVLATGRFESAQMFELSSDRRIATFAESQLKDLDEDAVVVVRLRWKDGT